MFPWGKVEFPWTFIGKWLFNDYFMGLNGILPSGKSLHNYGKSPFSISKSTISTGPCSIAIFVYQRVVHRFDRFFPESGSVSLEVSYFCFTCSNTLQVFFGP